MIFCLKIDTTLKSRWVVSTLKQISFESISLTITLNFFFCLEEFFKNVGFVYNIQQEWHCAMVFPRHKWLTRQLGQRANQVCHLASELDYIRNCFSEGFILAKARVFGLSIKMRFIYKFFQTKNQRRKVLHPPGTTTHSRCNTSSTMNSSSCSW